MNPKFTLLSCPIESFHWQVPENRALSCRTRHDPRTRPVCVGLPKLIKANPGALSREGVSDELDEIGLELCIFTVLVGKERLCWQTCGLSMLPHCNQLLVGWGVPCTRKPLLEASVFWPPHWSCFSWCPEPNGQFAKLLVGLSFFKWMNLGDPRLPCKAAWGVTLGPAFQLSQSSHVKCQAPAEQVGCGRCAGRSLAPWPLRGTNEEQRIADWGVRIHTLHR